MGLSKISEKCGKCPFLEKCDKEAMEALANIKPSLAAARETVTAGMIAPMARETLERYMYDEKIIMYKDELEKALNGALYAKLSIFNDAT